jgi:hypothetical protein
MTGFAVLVYLEVSMYVNGKENDAIIRKNAIFHFVKADTPTYIRLGKYYFVHRRER